MNGHCIILKARRIDVFLSLLFFYEMNDMKNINKKYVILLLSTYINTFLTHFPNSLPPLHSPSFPPSLPPSLTPSPLLHSLHSLRHSLTHTFLHLSRSAQKGVCNVRQWEDGEDWKGENQNHSQHIRSQLHQRGTRGVTTRQWYGRWLSSSSSSSSSSNR